MKLRVRSTATKETIRIDIPSSSSLFDLKTLISLNLSATTPIPPESIHLSLNRTDEIASSPDEPLHALGLTSGDLLFYSLNSILNSAPETQNISTASPGETLAPLSSAPDPPTDDMEVESESEPLAQQKEASVPFFLRRVMEPLHALGLTSGDILFYSHGSTLNPTPETQNLSSASRDETLAPLSSAPDPPTDDMEVESESEPLVQQKEVSVPCFLRRVMEAEKEKIKGNMGLTVLLFMQYSWSPDLSRAVSAADLLCRKDVLRRLTWFR